MTNEQAEKEWDEAIEQSSEKHMKEYFARNDLPGPGSSHTKYLKQK